jgi:hypothetical protein
MMSNKEKLNRANRLLNDACEIIIQIDDETNEKLSKL